MNWCHIMTATRLVTMSTERNWVNVTGGQILLNKNNNNFTTYYLGN
jgi:hypothetical protein